MEKGVKRKVEETAVLEEESLLRPKVKNRGRKRKRENSESSLDLDNALPDTALEMEKSLHASAIKNNLDDESVKKILKKVVTNDHVLALVKIREEEEAACSSPEANAPKLTRAKAKELMKASPNSAPWNLELTPIKHIPVKTRPEVKALIAQELPDDEDDEEYEPTHEDVPSDDEVTLESCSDVDSQPRTPATPCGQPSPRVLHDGPFKVPPPTTPARRKLQLPEEDDQATIALRTRSKINLSSTTIEHIESTFVPPDDVPPPRDEEWDQFLSGVFDPTGFREDDDPDETDPEYNVAADPDANEEDDLDGSILRISKKELNDLVTELFSILPEAAVADELADNLAKDVLTDTPHAQISSKWEGKQEILSDEENEQRPGNQERRDSTTGTNMISLGKSELEDASKGRERSSEKSESNDKTKAKKASAASIRTQPTVPPRRSSTVDVTVEERCVPMLPRAEHSPPPLLRGIKAQVTTDRVEIRIDEASKMEISVEQRAVLQQQMRQHVQLAASNFLQLFVNPLHWTMAPHYKKYLEQLETMVETNPSSVANVCNLRPALELVRSWEVSVSQDTPENRDMVDFIQKQAERSHRRFKCNSVYTGEFPETFKHVVANSSVFLYPYLLPAMPYRIESYRKFGYRRSEDELIAIGLDQFWQYLEDNPHLHKLKQPNPRTRVGLNATVTLVCKYMMPWLAPKLMLHHILRARREKDNPVHRFFETREVVPVKHKLLPYNPALTLYEQPEHEMPRIWVRYLAKSSKRFRNHLHRRQTAGCPPIDGVPIDIGSNIEAPRKNPLPIDFTRKITSNRNNVLPKVNLTHLNDKYDLEIEKVVANGNLETREQSIQAVNDNIIRKDSDLDRQSNNIPKMQTQFITLDSTLINNKNLINNVNITPINLFTRKKTIPQTDTKYGENLTAPNIDVSKERTMPSNLNTPINNIIGSSFIAQNLYKVVETSTGSFLVPLTVVQTTNTVDSIRGPIPSVQEGSALNNDEPEPKKDTRKDDSRNHCECCLMLRKICKEKQMKITDYFNPKREQTCRCSNRKYPKVSKRLKMLVNNFKSRTLCIHRELQQKLNLVKKEVIIENLENLEANESGYDLDDIAFVTSYQLKLLNRTNIARNNYLKKRVNTLFSKFDPEDGNVIYFTGELFKAFEVDLVDLYKEFLGFLTAEQAEKIDKFKDYFVQRCVEDLMKEIELEVTDTGTKQLVLSRLRDILVDAKSTSCEMCCSLMDGVCRYPRLARVVFDMFPHRTVVKEDGKRCSCAKNLQPVHSEPQIRDEEPRSQIKAVEEPNKPDTTNVDSVTAETDSNVSENETLTVIDYGADNSDSDDGETNEMSVVEATNTTHTSIQLQKTPDASNPDPDNSVYEDTTLTVTKTEIDEENDSVTTEMSALIMSEDETIKSEPTEWTRDEDKVILQLLLQHLTPEQRQGKTIMEILEDKNLVHVISDILPEKSLSDIRERVLYLVEILVMTD